MRPHCRHRADPSHTSTFAAALGVLLLTALWSALAAGPAPAAIVDSLAPPDYQVVAESAGPDYAGEVLISRGVAYVAGRVSDGAAGTDPSLLRLPVGSSTWTRTTLASVDGIAAQIAPGRSGAVYTSGNIRRANGTTRISVIKWTRSGKVSWQRSYAGPVAGFDGAMDVGTDSNGNVITCGVSEGTYGGDWAVVGWSSTGTKRWAWRYSGSGHAADVPAELLVDSSGNTYVTGTITVRGGATRVYTVKLSPKGRRLWGRAYAGLDGLSADAAAIARRPGGGVYVAGAMSRATGGRDALLVSYTSSGTRAVYPPAHMGAATSATAVYDIAVTTRGIVGVGSSNGDRFQCVWTTPTGTLSTFLWSTTFTDSLRRVTADAFGGVAITGVVATGEDTTAVETRRTPIGVSGGLQWTYQWSGPVAEDHSPSGIATSGGVVVVSGTCRSATTGSDQFIQVWRY